MSDLVDFMVWMQKRHEAGKIDLHTEVVVAGEILLYLKEKDVLAGLESGKAPVGSRDGETRETGRTAEPPSREKAIREGQS